MRNSKVVLRDKIFIETLKNAGLPVPMPEFRFHPERKWRFDFAYVEQKIAIEVEGGIWVKGRHTNPVGFINDMEKYNQAAILGWKILRFDSTKLNKRETLEVIKEAFNPQQVNYSIEESIF